MGVFDERVRWWGRGGSLEEEVERGMKEKVERELSGERRDGWVEGELFFIFFIFSFLTFIFFFNQINLF